MRGTELRQGEGFSLGCQKQEQVLEEGAQPTQTSCPAGGHDSQKPQRRERVSNSSFWERF